MVSASARLVVALLISVASAGCSSGTSAPPTASPGCLHNSDCAEPLLCLFATCARPCDADHTCARGERCLSTSLGAGCVAQSIDVCSSGCPMGTRCGGDDSCRTDCSTGACLSDQVCVAASHTCVGTDVSRDREAGSGAGGSGG